MKRKDSENKDVRREQVYLPESSTTSGSCEKDSDVVTQNYDCLKIDRSILIFVQNSNDQDKKKECIRDWKTLLGDIFLKIKPQDIFESMKKLSQKVGK